MEEITLNSLKNHFGDIAVYTQPMKVKHVIYIYYVAVRGRDDEEGSVQRVLNRRRISDIKNFILNNNIFFNSFILNWSNANIIPAYDENTQQITIPLIQSAAQVIDGQHRLAGLEAAVENDPQIGEKEILVSLAIGLDTKEAAKIFLNINSEQKPVPKSLIYDLFGEVVDDEQHAINRAGDIARELNENPESPYYGAIKYPGTPRGRGVVDLSSVINSLKKALEPGGKFHLYNLDNLEYQKKIVLNYFIAISFYYRRRNIWNNKTKNPFFTNAGFIGSIEHLLNTLMAKCSERRSFTIDTFKELLRLENSALLSKADLKNMGGSSQRKRVMEFLETNLLAPAQNEYDI